MNNDDFSLEEWYKALLKGDNYQSKIASTRLGTTSTVNTQTATTTAANIQQAMTSSTSTISPHGIKKSIRPITVGDNSFDPKELGVLLDYLLRQHKETHPECYI